jgi:cobalamin biosynthesis protein CobD/CbiB
MILAAAAQTTTTVTINRSPSALPGWELALTTGIVVVLALLAIGAVYFFYRAVGRGAFMENTMRQWIIALRPQAGSVSSVIDEFVTRRYEFLTFFGQIIIASLVVTVIALLLLADRITAEAGLPVLATILGIILGKTVQSRRALPERPQESDQALRLDDDLSDADLATGDEEGTEPTTTQSGE